MKTQDLRDMFIKKLNENKNDKDFLFANSDYLFSLDLTMYSDIYSFNSAIYKAINMSRIDKNISLHPEQVKVLDLIDNEKGLILSAPTSFGKTFTIFEYIVRNKPKNVVLVVPTLALVDEYKRNVINSYRESFKLYNVYLSIDDNKKYDFNKYNLFIVTHDRLLNNDMYKIIKKIDFLVIDEVYKLKKNENDNRVLILNIAYYNMVSISKKYVLLAPFISDIENKEKLVNQPKFYSTSFSPVVNDIVSIKINNENNRKEATKQLLEKISGNTLVYFPTVKSLNDYIASDDKLQKQIQNKKLQEFANWAKREIHEEWAVVKALERGYLIHHGQLPMGIRMLELDLFNENNDYNVLFCTSTLLEGVNTSAENIIITKPARSMNDFDAFDFFNLVGRTGRLYKYYLGNAYYIQGPNDKEYYKEDAIKSIEFEITSDSIDIDINIGNYKNRKEFLEFLDKLNIDYDSYKKDIAQKIRFNTANNIYEKYLLRKNDLLNEIDSFINEGNKSKLYIIREIYKIVDNGDSYDTNVKTFIINKLTYKNPHKLKQIINDTYTVYGKKYNIQEIIRHVLNIKNSYIEHEFYKRTQVLISFMKYQNVDTKYINIIESKILKNIEQAFYINQPSNKMLKDIGIYDSDIKTIIKEIGDDFETVEDLQNRLKKFSNINSVSIVSRYVINRFIANK